MNIINKNISFLKILKLNKNDDQSLKFRRFIQRKLSNINSNKNFRELSFLIF